MPRPYIRLRETTFDLYVERDLLPGYYKVISVLSTWLVLAGYILFAVVFTSREEDLTALRSLVLALASALLIIGYVGIMTVALFCRSLLFLIDGLLWPSLTASLVGLFTTVANHLLHKEKPEPQIYMSIPLVTACVTAVVCLIILAIAYRELRKIRRRDDRRRWQLQLGPYMGAHDPHMPVAVFDPDDDAQRKQLMKLLQDRQEGIRSQENINNTFKIDLPGEFRADAQRDIIEERRSPARGGFGLHNLMPWRNDGSAIAQDARERRREEIERSSISNSREPRRTYDSDQHITTQPPAWGWPPATRYA